MRQDTNLSLMTSLFLVFFTFFSVAHVPRVSFDPLIMTLLSVKLECLGAILAVIVLNFYILLRLWHLMFEGQA